MTTTNWSVVTTSSPSITLPSQDDGTYEIEVTAIDPFGNRSSVTTAEQKVSANAVGRRIEGDNVEPLNPIVINRLGVDRLIATWLPAETPRLNVSIRHSPVKSAAWGSSNPLLGEKTWTSASASAELPLLQGTYLFRHLAPNGEPSQRIQRHWITDPGDPFQQVSAVAAESFPFGGAKENCMNDSLQSGLTLFRLRWDDLSDLNTLLDPIDSYGNRVAASYKFWDDLPSDLSGLTQPIDDYGRDDRLGTYYFANRIELSDDQVVFLQRQIVSKCIYRATRWDDFVGLVDEIPSMESPPEAGYVQMEFRANASNQWGEWQPLARAQTYGKIFEFRAQIFGGDINQDVVISSLKATAYTSAVPAGLLTHGEEQSTLSVVVVPGATATGSVVLPQRCILLSLASNSAAWLRLYSSTAAMAADASRPVTTPPTKASGVIADPVFVAAETMQLEPVLQALNRETPRTTSYPFRITNNGTGSSVQIIVTHYQL
jgi:hypothetical protein